MRGLAGVPLLPQPQLEAAARPPGGNQGPRLAIEVTTVMMVLLMIAIMLLGHSACFNTAVTKQDFLKILGVSSYK